jgi:hypothetical protein
MKAQIISAAALAGLFCGSLAAVDPQLLNLAMPDAKVIAGANVLQAQSSPFGQYVLSQMFSNAREIATLTGFDPSKDVNEVLAVSNAQPGSAAPHPGLVLATGTFNVASISSFAAQKGAATESYKGVTILEDPKQTHGIAFLSGTLAASGDIASVKAAIDRQSSPAVLPSDLVVQVNQLSGSQDAWALTTVPPSGLKPPSNAPPIPGLGNGAQNAFGSIKSATAGVKFGSMVTLTVQAQADSEQNATNIVGVLQLLANMAQLQASSNPQGAALAQSLTVQAQGSTVNISASLPEAQVEQLVKPKTSPGSPARPHRAERRL